MEEILDISDITIQTTDSDVNIDSEVVLSNTQELEVYIEPREYKILGDNVFIPAVSDEAPQWLLDTITNLTNINLDTTLRNLDDIYADLQAALDAIIVAKNQYTQSIISYAETDLRINAVLTTLNSSLNGVDATLRDLIATKVTPSESSVIALNAINTSINDVSTGTSLGSLIATIKNSITTLNNTTNNNYTLLESHLNSVVSGNALALDTLYTNVGIDESGNSTGSGVLGRLEIIEKQTDGVVETYSGTYDVITYNELNGTIDQDTISLVTTAEPYATWLASETTNTSFDKRAAHIGDMYLKYVINSSGMKEFVASYKFIKTVVDVDNNPSTPDGTDAQGFTWAKVVASMSDAAYALALNAIESSSDKMRMFTSTPVAPYKAGDLWLKTYVSNGLNYTKLMTTNVTNNNSFNLADWVEANTTQQDFITNVYTPKVTTLQNQVDNKIEYYFKLSTQGTPNYSTLSATERLQRDGDIVYFTDTKKSYYYSYSTNSWLKYENADIDTALAEIAKTNTNLNGKITTYYVEFSYYQPSTLVRNKYWFDTFGTQQLFQANGTILSWNVLNASGTPKLSVGDLLYIYGSTEPQYNTTFRFNGTNWQNVSDGKITVVANKVTTLEAKVDKNNTDAICAISILCNQVKAVTGTNGDATVSSKFEYGSVLSLNGTNYTTGFGIVTSLTSNSVIASGSSLAALKPTVSGTSEFWVTVDKFKMVSAQCKYTPFSIDTSTGRIKLDGIVEFSNIKNTPSFASSADVALAINNFNSSTTLSDKINSIAGIKASAVSNACTDAFAKNLGYANYTDLYNCAVAGKTIINAGMISTSLINADALVIGKNNGVAGNGIVINKDKVVVYSGGIARVTLGLLG